MKAFPGVLVNQAPFFKTHLETEIFVTGSDEDSSVLIYVSPRATDPDGHAIVISFSGVTDLGWAFAYKNDDDSFTLEIKTQFIGREGVYTLKVSLGDELEPALSTYDINIHFTQEA